ncbi:MAG: alpha-ketoacid dehydrogenase subunit beta, partial [Cyanobacteria bacterium J06635_11]
PVIRLSSQDIPTPYNKGLEDLTIVQPAQIEEAVEKIMTGRL